MITSTHRFTVHTNTHCHHEFRQHLHHHCHSVPEENTQPLKSIIFFMFLTAEAWILSELHLQSRAFIFFCHVFFAVASCALNQICLASKSPTGMESSTQNLALIDPMCLCLDDYINVVTWKSWYSYRYICIYILLEKKILIRGAAFTRLGTWAD